MIEVVLIGNGKLADSIRKTFNKYSSFPIRKYTQDSDYGSNTIFVHVGSGRQYKETLKQAMNSGALYIQAATEKDYPLTIPQPGSFCYLHCPNLDINIIKLFHWLQLGSSLFKEEELSILESHQEEKKSRPGTAIKICDLLNIPYDKIISIRQKTDQIKLGINNLDHHAFHRITIGSGDSKISIETKIEGAESYAKGLARIINASLKLDNGIYEIEDLVRMDLI